MGAKPPPGPCSNSWISARQEVGAGRTSMSRGPRAQRLRRRRRLRPARRVPLDRAALLGRPAAGIGARRDRPLHPLEHAARIGRLHRITSQIPPWPGVAVSTVAPAEVVPAIQLQPNTVKTRSLLPGTMVEPATVAVLGITAATALVEPNST